MKNMFTKKIKIFPNWLELKTAKIVFPIIIIVICVGFLFASIQTIWQQHKCDSRGYTWFSIPPSGKISNSIHDLVMEKTFNYYREEYL